MRAAPLVPVTVHCDPVRMPAQRFNKMNTSPDLSLPPTSHAGLSGPGRDATPGDAVGEPVQDSAASASTWPSLQPDAPQTWLDEAMPLGAPGSAGPASPASTEPLSASGDTGATAPSSKAPPPHLRDYLRELENGREPAVVPERTPGRAALAAAPMMQPIMPIMALQLLDLQSPADDLEAWALDNCNDDHHETASLLTVDIRRPARPGPERGNRGPGGAPGPERGNRGLGGAPGQHGLGRESAAWYRADIRSEPQPFYDSYVAGPLATNALMRLRELGDPQYEALAWRMRNRHLQSWAYLRDNFDAIAWYDVLEDDLNLNKAACQSLFLLAQQGPPGQVEANRILWNFLCRSVRDAPAYYDNSSMMISQVRNARRNIDRPPESHKDWKAWTPAHALGVPPQLSPEFWPTRLREGDSTVASMSLQQASPLRPLSTWASPHSTWTSSSTWASSSEDSQQRPSANESWQWSAWGITSQSWSPGWYWCVHTSRYMWHESDSAWWP